MSKTINTPGQKHGGLFSQLTSLYQENREQGHLLLSILGVFLIIYFVPAGSARFDNAILEAVRLTSWYAQEHVILCLLPAFLIAGAMSVYISQGSVLHYLGPQASKPIALGVASVSGTLLAVCSCTVLPLFGGIYKRGAGLGAAIAFLYSGPAINIMAIVVTAKVLGPELVFANWAAADNSAWMGVYQWKWQITSFLAILFAALLVFKWKWPAKHLLILAGLIVFSALLFPGNPQLPFAIGAIGLVLIAATREQDQEWAAETWSFTKQIMPLLLGGVFVAGLLLGRPGFEGLIPSEWVSLVVGDNSLLSTLLASILGAFMYFSTLTEVPIVEGLLGAGMGKGPALAKMMTAAQ